MNEHTRRARAQVIFSRGLVLIALACVFADGALAQIAQEGWRVDRAVARVQDAVRERILSERGRQGDAGVVFNNDAQRFTVSASQTGVRGTGVYTRGARGRREEFSYSAVYNTRNRRVDQVDYRITEESGGGGGRREVPRWLVGTFRGQNPSTRRQRMLVTVEDDGRVSVVYGNGQRESGSYSDRQLRAGSTFVWNVSRNADGIRLQDDRTRRFEDFVRVGDAADGGDNDRVPRWAVGTFRGTTADGEAELTINRDGSAVARSLAYNTTFQGRFDNGVLTFDWGSFNVAREPDGIRTVKVNDRNSQTYYRRVN